MVYSNILYILLKFIISKESFENHLFLINLKQYSNFLNKEYHIDNMRQYVCTVVNPIKA